MFCTLLSAVLLVFTGGEYVVRITDSFFFLIVCCNLTCGLMYQ